MANIVVGLVIAVAFVLALRKTISNARNGGCAGCSGGSCRGCSSASADELNALAERLAEERKETED